MTEESKPHWKTKLSAFGTKVFSPFKKENLLRAIQNFDAQTFSESASKLFQKQGAAFYGTLATIVLSTYFLSDLVALMVNEYIPTPPARNFKIQTSGFRPKTINDYSTIFSRNLFNSRGLIPGDVDPNASKTADPGGAPVKSTLPLNLIGTLIMSNEARSIATIEDKSNSQVFPMQVDDEIPGKIKVLKIEFKRVIFLNKGANRREYLELPEDPQSQNVRLTPGKPSGIEKVAPTQFNVPRSEVDKAFTNMNNILTQARAEPNPDGGYRLSQIVPGSIYDKLGLQNGDIILGLNGEPINDPGKAFKLLEELKTANHLELQVKRNGRTQNNVYDINSQ